MIQILLVNSHPKIVKILSLLLILSFFVSPNFLLATSEEKDPLNLQSVAAVVMDYDTGRVLYTKNATEPRPMASLTKVMTSILLVENCDLEEMIEVPSEATWIGGSTVGLKKGDKVSAKALLYGMLLPSGNDCAYTVGLHIGGSIENFANLMTMKAKSIGITDTSFANPHGLDNENHYTSAKSMALIAKYALQNPTINEIVNTKTATVSFGSFTKTLNNTNALLRTYDKADGVKTGFTNGANRCLVASATDHDRRYIAVILGAETTEIRFREAKEILEYCFENYQITDISNYLKFYINLPVIKGSISFYERSFNDTLSIPLTKEEYDQIYVIQTMEENLVAPISAGSKIGKVKVLLKEEVLYEKEIYLEESISKKTPFDYFQESFKNMFLPVYSII